MKVTSSANSNENNLNEDNGVLLKWKADAMSWQDAYQISYAEIITGLTSSSSASESLIASSVLTSGNNFSQSQNGSLRQAVITTATISTDSNIIVISAFKESIEDQSMPIECTLESLLPGRNYSISVRALSSDVASNNTVVYYTMSML